MANTPFGPVDSDVSPALLPLATQQAVEVAVSANVTSTSSGDRIFDYTAGGAVASIDSNTILGGNIPSTFSHLRLVLVLRGDVSATSTLLRFNNDSGANYEYISVTAATPGSPGSAAFTDGSGATSILMGALANDSNTAGATSIFEIFIPNYLGTTFWKNMHGAETHSYNTTMEWRSKAGVWRSTAAITRISITPNAGNYVAGSRVTLYGLT